MILTVIDSMWPTVGSILLSLVVTFLFNYFIGLPKKFKDARKAEEQEKENLEKANKRRDKRLDDLEEVVNNLPKYREQSKRIQAELKDANRQMLDTRLKSLENREKNALREKIYQLWRTFTDDYLNPMLAWTDMEKHSFDELVRDYESLGGNDYVHKVILPDMIKLEVICMDNLDLVKRLYESRNTRKTNIKD